MHREQTRYELQALDGTVLAKTSNENYVGRAINAQRRKGNNAALVVVQYHNGKVRDRMDIPEGMTVTLR